MDDIKPIFAKDMITDGVDTFSIDIKPILLQRALSLVSSINIGPIPLK